MQKRVHTLSSPLVRQPQKLIMCDRLGAACCARGGGIMDGNERSDEDSIEKPEAVDRFSCIS